MIFNRFGLALTLRALLIAAIAVLSAWLWSRFDLFFVHIFMVLAFVSAIVELIYYVNYTNRELHKFFEAIKHDDYAVNFSRSKLGQNFTNLNEALVALIEKLKKANAYTDSQSQLFETIVGSLPLGVMVISEDWNIIIMNESSQKMLSIPHFPTWETLKKKKPGFADYLGNFDFSGRKLMTIDQGEYYLDLEAISLIGKKYYLVSFSSIKDEIEQKEVDAWHKLIRILAHEVMNSVTPVTSLSETIKTILIDETGKPIEKAQLDDEKIGDIIEALDTIINRSKGMLAFVDDYRKLTKLPAPNFETIEVKGIVKDVMGLMEPSAKRLGIQIQADLPDNKVAIRGDRKMVEQVLINLIKNSFNALEEAQDGNIVIRSLVKENSTVIEVSDNGAGIEEDLLPSIFIPFFSTQKNGTGIGLTLSKNIMQLHNGSIRAASTYGQGASFKLVFPQ